MLVQIGKRCVSEQRDIDPFFAESMRDLLSRSKVFRDCHEGFVKDLIVTSNRKEYAPNRYIMEEGMRGDSMFVIFKGVVEVSSNGRYVCKLRDGSIVGEAALLNIDNKRTASVRTIQKCDVAIIFRSTFHSILEKYPWEKRKFLRDMKAKLIELGKLVNLREDVNLEQQSQQFDMLKQVPFFADDASLHDFAAELAMNATTVWYRPGKVIIQEGDNRCEEMYALLQGAVEVTACGEFLGRLEHDLFGEICVMEVLESRTANVIAATEVHCMVFSRQVILPMLSKYPDARVRLLEHARQRLLQLNQTVSGDKQQLAITNSASRGIAGCATGFGTALQNEDARMFAASPIFRKAPVPLLVELSEKLTDRKIQEDQEIIVEGDPIVSHKDQIFFIAKGSAEVCKGDDVVAVLSQGDVFGDELVTDSKNTKRDLTVRAKTRMVVRTMNLVHLVAFLQEHYMDADIKAIMSDWAEQRNRLLGKTTRFQVQRELGKKKGTHLDVMFLKLPTVTTDGHIVPRTQPLKEAMLGIRAPHSARQGLNMTDLPPVST